MNTEKVLDVVASIVVFIGKFIVTPVVALIVIISLWSVGVETYSKHIPWKTWLISLGIVTVIFGGISLSAWASVRMDDKRYK